MSIVLLFSFVYIQTTKKQSLCLDNDGSIIETLNRVSLVVFFLIIITTHIALAQDTYFLSHEVVSVHRTTKLLSILLLSV